jgi:hypothetical protein
VTQSTIASVTPTVCALLGIAPPALSSEPALAAVLQDAGEIVGGPVERCLVYCPDALGDHVWERFPQHRDAVQRRCPRRVSVSSVLPPKTPVCFSSVFTGGSPEQHGIRRAERPRPLLTCDTLFDAAVRARKRVAIVAVTDSSIDLMFKGRALDYFSESHDEAATARALALIAEDRHDLIVLYNQEYDDQLHLTQPFSPECVRALEHHVATVDDLAEAIHESWAGHDRAMLVAPDHGAHLDPETGRGDHGLDIPEDMRVSHWYEVRAAFA